MYYVDWIESPFENGSALFQGPRSTVTEARHEAGRLELGFTSHKSNNLPVTLDALSAKWLLFVSCVVLMTEQDSENCWRTTSKFLFLFLLRLTRV